MPKARKRSTALARQLPAGAIIKRRSALKLVDNEMKLFDIDAIYEKASDAKGHSEELRLRVPVGTLATIHEIIRRAPQYKNQQTFLRTWLVHGLTYTAGKLDANEPFESDRFMRHMVEIHHNEMMEKTIREDKQIEELEKNLVELITADHPDDLAGLSGQVNELLTIGPSSRAFRQRLERIKERAERHLPPEETE